MHLLNLILPTFLAILLAEKLAYAGIVHKLIPCCCKDTNTKEIIDKEIGQENANVSAQPRLMDLLQKYDESPPHEKANLAESSMKSEIEGLETGTSEIELVKSENPKQNPSKIQIQKEMPKMEKSSTTKSSIYYTPNNSNNWNDSWSSRRNRYSSSSDEESVVPPKFDDGPTSNESQRFEIDLGLDHQNSADQAHKGPSESTVSSTHGNSTVSDVHHNDNHKSDSPSHENHHLESENYITYDHSNSLI